MMDDFFSILPDMDNLRKKVLCFPQLPLMQNPTCNAYGVKPLCEVVMNNNETHGLSIL